jgi:hypothetical protein
MTTQAAQTANNGSTSAPGKACPSSAATEAANTISLRAMLVLAKITFIDWGTRGREEVAYLKGVTCL